jgi:MarR family
MTSQARSEAEILEQGIAVLQEALPLDWQVQRQPDAEPDGPLADAVLTIDSKQTGAIRVVVEIKRAFSPKDLPAVVRQARLLNRIAGNTPVLVMAPWLSDRSRARLTEAGINYVTLSRDIRFVSEYPPVFIYVQSNVPGPKRHQSSPSLKGVKAGRIARLLIDVRPPYGVRDIAKYAAVTPGYVSRLLDGLESEELIERDKRGGVATVNWRELIIRRAGSYGVFTSNSIQRFVCPNGPGYALGLAGDPPSLAEPVSLTGSFAAERLVSVAPPDLLILYAHTEPAELIRRAGLLQADAGANVVIAKPSDLVVAEPRWPRKQALPPRVPLVAASQVALDCLTGIGRMLQEGEAFLDWMAVDEGVWRLTSLAELTAAAVHDRA